MESLKFPNLVVKRVESQAAAREILGPRVRTIAFLQLETRVINKTKISMNEMTV